MLEIIRIQTGLLVTDIANNKAVQFYDSHDNRGAGWL